MATDFHNHLIPGVDDGAQSVDEALEAVEAFRRDGVTCIIATPHIDASVTLDERALAARLGQIDEGWRLLTDAVTNHFADVTIARGCELALDVPVPNLNDPRLRLNGGRFFLMEFPFMTVPPRAASVVGTLRGTGYVPVIAHPERYQGVRGAEAIRSWREQGARLQVNGGSLLGRYGERPRQLAFELLSLGLVDYICSDYHARGVPQTSEFQALLIEQDAAEQAHTLMETNPRRLMDGLDPLPVAPVITRPSLWRRMSRIFR